MAMILTCYYRPKPGGFCTRLFRAIEALLDRGHTVHYLAVEKFPVDRQGCIFHRFPWPVRHADTLLFWAVFHCLAPLWLICIAFRHRVTHAFAFGPTYAFLLQPVRILKCIRLTCFFRADTIENHRIKETPQWIIAMEKVIEALAIQNIHVVGVSRHLNSAIIDRHRYFRPLSSHVLPNDLAYVECTGQRHYGTPLRLAVVGILEERKNQQFVLRLMANLPNRNWNLFFYGVGPDEPGVKRLAMELGLSDHVFFMGWQDRERIWPNIDLLLAPSKHEGMPNAVLEAVANEVPILASDIAAHGGLLPANQLLPLDNRDKWLAALVQVFDNTEMVIPSMVQNQNRVSHHLWFDWNEQIAQLITDEK